MLSYSIMTYAYLLSVCLLWSVSSGLLPIFKADYQFSYLLSFKISVYIFSFIKYVFCKYYIFMCGWSPYSLNIKNSIFYRAEFLNLNEVQHLNVLQIILFHLYLKNHWQTLGHLGWLLLPSRSCIVWHFTLRSLVHFELIFLWRM